MRNAPGTPTRRFRADASAVSFVTAHVLRPISGVTDLLEAFETLRTDPYPWLLDSALEGSPHARFSFAGSSPYLVVRGFARVGKSEVEIECRDPVRPDLSPGTHRRSGDPLALACSLLPPPPIGDPAPEIPLIGGAVGYVGYEYVQTIEALALRAKPGLVLPDLELLFVDRLLVFDHRTREIAISALGFGHTDDEARARARRTADAVAQRFRRPRHRTRPLPSTPAAGGGPRFAGFFDECSYGKAVRALLENIAAGEVYQACLTQRLEAPFRSDPWLLYRHLRELNPAPFASFIDLPEVAILSSSPERFLRVGGDGWAESRPIKGTRPRGKTAAEDVQLRRELAGSAKDRAENLMIVDLVRNDLGRVCEPGTIEVPDLFVIEAYATLFQLVSTVRGRLRGDQRVVDLIQACFPPGSMTGAPKIAAMRILDAVEPVRRGIYAGALGYFDLRGGADLSVVIRTLFLHQGSAMLHVGGGVVADSDPLAEYQESLDKAKALQSALCAVGADSEAIAPDRESGPISFRRSRFLPSPGAR